MIELNDSIKRYRGSKYITLYRCFCDVCGCDRGYLTKQNGQKSKCIKCSHKTVSEETRNKMSLSKRNKIPHNKGKHGVREETRVKMRKARLGKSSSNKGKPCDSKKKIKISCSIRGLEENEFNGFVHPENKRLRNSDTSRELSKTCHERDNYTCQRCSKRGKYIHAHHINSWKFFPEQRFDLNNLITLCKDCHKDFHSKYGNGIREANTREQFEEWVTKEKEGPKTLRPNQQPPVHQACCVAL